MVNNSETDWIYVAKTVSRCLIDHSITVSVLFDTDVDEPCS
jgi:hypothetical protein